MTQKSIVCYGDSNTWGYVPCTDHSVLKKRYPRDQRWPGILQQQLGDDYYVVEEGLNSRTTNLDYAPPPDRNGKTYLPSCLYSHAPIDLVILALGGNDLKTYFDRSAAQIKNGLSELVDIIQLSPYGVDLQSPPTILITTPVIPMDFVEQYVDENGTRFLEGAVAKSKQCVDLFAELAKEKSCHYLDLSKDVLPSGIDGVHYDQAAHIKFAYMVTKKVREIYSEK